MARRITANSVSISLRSDPDTPSRLDLIVSDRVCREEAYIHEGSPTVRRYRGGITRCTRGFEVADLMKLKQTLQSVTGELQVGHVLAAALLQDLLTQAHARRWIVFARHLKCVSKIVRWALQNQVLQMSLPDAVAEHVARVLDRP